MDCIFCSIIEKKTDSTTVYEDEFVIGIMDLFPATEGHVLVIPKVHSEIVADIDDEYVAKMSKAAKLISIGMRKASIKLEALSFVLSDGKSAGQEIPHAHLHIIPRYQGDGIGFRFGSKRKYSKPELERIAAEIKNNLV